MKTILYTISAHLLLSISFAQFNPEGVSVHRLNNGMEVIFIENKSLPMVGANVVVKTGSAYETYATSGMSHMLEHLLFNGTTTRAQKELYDDGDRIGAYNNANTGEFYTNYMMVTPTEHIQSGMEIQADMLFNSILPDEKYEKEKGIVLEEIAQSLARPETQIKTDIQSILFQGHSLSLPTLGTYATIESLPLSPVRQYYKGNYVPNNMILSVVGNFDSATMLEWVKNIYGKPGPGSVFRPEDGGFVTGFDSSHMASGVYHRSHSDTTTLIHLAFGLPSNPLSGFFDLMEELLSNQTDKLQAEAKNILGASIQSIKGEIRQSPVGNFLIVKASLGSDEIVTELISFLSEEISDMKFSMKKDAVSAFTSAEKTSFYKSLEKPHMFGIYNAHVFAEKGVDGFLSSFNESMYSNAAKALKKYKIEGEPTVIIHHPLESGSQDVSKSNSAQLFDHEESGTTLIAKQNGSSPLLAVHYLFKHKSRFENEFGKEAAKILHDCFGQRMKSNKVQNHIAPFGLTFTVNDNPWIPMDDIYLHHDFGYIRVEGLADDLNGAIQFLNRAFLDFTPTQAEFEKANSPSFGGMKRKNVAKEKFNELMNEHLYGSLSQENNPPELTYESLLSFAKKYWTPENVILSIISPESPPKVNSLFSGFGNNLGIDKTSGLDKSYNPASMPISIEEDGGGAQSYLFWGFIKEINPEDKPALLALSLILKDKIVFDIREKQGLAYRMHAGISIKKNKALFSINFGTRPENVDVIIPQFSRLFSMNMLNDLDASMVEKSVNMYLGRMMFRRLSSINQAYYLGYSQYFEGDMNSDTKFLNRLKAVTLVDVNRVAKKYMDGQIPISIIVR
ncbi:MAG: insulinase family protein [Candidatus Marinimicrobia bacterium]|nr:insulinase family protein [Candidatus Neomarinimicrobiota bacterium]MBL7010902.1 insulinase family protein [Candidatus Neomarinimicrobiota bacterium]MBL7030269.1 insulinase family protein [Candidatus Neomarinimicrobiota bacterium]